MYPQSLSLPWQIHKVAPFLLPQISHLSVWTEVVFDGTLLWLYPGATVILLLKTGLKNMLIKVSQGKALPEKNFYTKWSNLE